MNPKSKANRLQLEIQRGFSGLESLAIAIDMSEMVREFSRSRLRSLNPDWTEEQVTRELVRVAFSPASSPW